MPRGAKPGLRPKRGRPTNAERLLKQAQALKDGVDPKAIGLVPFKGRTPNSIVKLDVSESAVAKWLKPDGLRDAARAAIGLALQTITAVLKAGKMVNGIRPEVALAHAMGSPLLKVAGYDDKAPAAPQVTLVQVAIGNPGSGSEVSARVLEVVREPKAIVDSPQVIPSVEVIDGV
jgi:hypothetical protein